MDRQAEQFGHLAKTGAQRRLAVDDADHRAVVDRGQLSSPFFGGIRRVRRDPAEGHLVAVEKAAKLGAGRVPAVPDARSPSAAVPRRRCLAAHRSCSAPTHRVARRSPGTRPRPRGSRRPRRASHASVRQRGTRAETASRAQSAPRRRALLPSRPPTTVGIPSTRPTVSSRPSSTANNARSSPSCTANSPGTSLMSAALRESGRTPPARARRRSRCRRCPRRSARVSVLRHAANLTGGAIARALDCLCRSALTRSGDSPARHHPAGTTKGSGCTQDWPRTATRVTRWTWLAEPRRGSSRSSRPSPASRPTRSRRKTVAPVDEVWAPRADAEAGDEAAP